MDRATATGLRCIGVGRVAAASGSLQRILNLNRGQGLDPVGRWWRIGRGSRCGRGVGVALAEPFALAALAALVASVALVALVASAGLASSPVGAAESVLLASVGLAKPGAAASAKAASCAALADAAAGSLLSVCGPGARRLRTPGRGCALFGGSGCHGHSSRRGVGRVCYDRLGPVLQRNRYRAAIGRALGRDWARSHTWPNPYSATRCSNRAASRNGNMRGAEVRWSANMA